MYPVLLFVHAQNIAQFSTRTKITCRWPFWRPAGEGSQLPPKILGCQILLTNFLWKDFRPNIQHFNLKTPVLEKFRGDVETLSTPDLLWRKFATFCSAYFFLSHDVRSPLINAMAYTSVKTLLEMIEWVCCQNADTCREAPSFPIADP